MSISVIIPTYNRAAVLARAIDSVLAQTLAADEIIVIDDGSTDETKRLIKNNYSDIIYLQQNNQGVSSARNLGIKHAKSEWIAMLDSDDEWLPEKLQKQLQLASESPQHHILHSEEIWIRNGVRVNAKHKHKKYGGDIFQHCLPLCCISPSAVMIHRRLFNDVGLFDEQLPACEDYDLWLRICCQYEVLFTEQPLIIKYGGHDDQLSRHYWGMDRFRIQALEKLINSNKLTPDQTALTYATLKKKISIFLKGAKKHGNTAMYEEYKTKLENLQD